LKAVIALIEVTPSNLEWRRVLFKIPQLGQAFADSFPFRDAFQEGESYFILSFNPSSDLWRFPDILFQPAVGIGLP
jgi:hypothetical protein